MWPGEQPPTGGQNPQQPTGGGQSNPQPNAGAGGAGPLPGAGAGQPNPYRQPGYQQPHPYHQEPAPWNAPTVTADAAAPPAGRGDGRRTKVVAMASAAAVVIAAGVTGFVLLGPGKDDGAGPEPTGSPSAPSSPASDPRGTEDAEKPTVAGWKTVVNPKRGIAFDVPPQWGLKSTDWVTYVSEDDDPRDEPLAAVAAPALLKEKWCGSDDDKDGTEDYTMLAGAGTKRNNGAKTPEEAARDDAAAWVYGAYTQPDRKLVTSGAVEPYTTKSGITGSLATASSSGVEKSKKCAGDGKATVFSFKDPSNDIVSWEFFGAKGVSEEVSDTTVRKIVATVRFYDVPPAS
ncbi:hypothetical protein [Streptomyces sp. Tue6028]|uniref:hypothetical protein n=1 Tax=Streptomyces sp. Tue6028 TaxID=2036037 RepID=UPI003D73AB72